MTVRGVMNSFLLGKSRKSDKTKTGNVFMTVKGQGQIQWFRC